MNPRAAINDLLPFQGSPFGQLGYFSKLSYLPNCVVPGCVVPLNRPSNNRYCITYLSYCQVLFSTFSKKFLLNKRREWDSNPRALADKRFSRPPRYDHFDISPFAFLLFCTSKGKNYSIIDFSICQQLFLFFSTFYLSPNFRFGIAFRSSPWRVPARYS